MSEEGLYGVIKLTVFLKNKRKVNYFFDRLSYGYYQLSICIEKNVRTSISLSRLVKRQGHGKRKAEKFAFYLHVHCYTGGTRENELILILS